jgi:hypothetical protein
MSKEKLKSDTVDSSDSPTMKNGTQTDILSRKQNL